MSQVRAWLCQSSRGRRGPSVTKRHDREQDRRTRSMDRRRIAPPDGPGGGRACRPVTGDLGTEERTTSGTARCARRDLETRGHLRGTLGAYEPAESGTLHLILARVRSGSRGVGFECGMVPRRAMAVEEHVPRRETYIHGSPWDDVPRAQIGAARRGSDAARSGNQCTLWVDDGVDHNELLCIQILRSCDYPTMLCCDPRMPAFPAGRLPSVPAHIRGRGCVGCTGVRAALTVPHDELCICMNGKQCSGNCARNAPAPPSA